MNSLVLGSVALDTVKTPMGNAQETLGGSASYFSCAAQFFTPVNLVSVVGKDFPQQYIKLFKSKHINLDGLEKTDGKTFRWTGFYGNNLNDAQTLKTQLNVLGTFKPNIPPHYRTLSAVFLANFDPDLQLSLLNQMKNPKLIACDTMNLWITIKKKSLLRLLKKVHIVILNDSEAKQLTGINNLFKAAKAIRKLGPKTVVIKKGEHGCMLFANGEFFTAPCYPVEQVYDPTGAGDTFAGGFFGYIASQNSVHYQKYLKKAVIYGNVLASFTVEAFSLNKLKTITNKDIHKRFQYIKKSMLF